MKCLYSVKFLLNQILVGSKQYVGINNVDQGFAMHYRAISNTVRHLEVFRRDRISTAKQTDGLTLFLILNVLESKIFQYDFLDLHNA